MLLLVFNCLAQNGLRDVQSLLRRYVSDMAKSLIPNHPWSQIWQLFAMLDIESFDRAVLHSWRCTLDGYKRILGPDSPYALESNLDFIWNVNGATDPHLAERHLRDILASAYDPMVCNVLSQILFQQKRYEEAEKLGLNLVHRCNQHGMTAFSPTIKARTLAFLAMTQYRLGQIDSGRNYLAERNLRDAIDLLVSKFGGTNVQAIYYKNTLSTMLRRVGRGDEADQLKAEVDCFIGRDGIDEEQCFE